MPTTTVAKRTLGLFLIGAAACGGDGAASPTPSGFAITSAGEALGGTAGDALQLQVVQTFSDDSQGDLPAGATMTFTAPPTVAASPPGTEGPSALPAAGAPPTGVFLTNAPRGDHQQDLAGVLFLLDAGAGGSGVLAVSAAIGGSARGSAEVDVPVMALPAGSAARGATLYASACARCHGADASGSPVGSDGLYHYGGGMYAYPAPNLGTGSDGVGGDPAWTAALLAMAARADVDNAGVSLRQPMPDFTTLNVGDTPLATGDFADIYAFLTTQ